MSRSAAALLGVLLVLFSGAGIYYCSQNPIGLFGRDIGINVSGVQRFELVEGQRVASGSITQIRIQPGANRSAEVEVLSTGSRAVFRGYWDETHPLRIDFKYAALSPRRSSVDAAIDYRVFLLGSEQSLVFEPARLSGDAARIEIAENAGSIPAPALVSVESTHGERTSLGYFIEGVSVIQITFADAAEGQSS